MSFEIIVPKCGS